MPSLAELAETQVARDVAAPELAPAVPAAAEVEAAPATELSAEGPLPEVSPTGQLAEPAATASEQAFGDKVAEAPELTGMYEPEAYKAACEAAGTPDRWHDNYARGHTGARQWVQPYEGRYDMTFTLKPGYSASQAVKDFLQGPTVGDYSVIAVAIELDQVRDTMGDRKFDQLFGSADLVEDARIAQRLAITSAMYTIPFAAQMEALADERDEAERFEEPPPAAVAAQVEDKPLAAEHAQQPAPELVAEELGIAREHEEFA